MTRIDEKALEAIDTFNRIVENVEARCMAVDGPVTPTLKEMSEVELSSLWEAVQAIRSALIAEAVELVAFQQRVAPWMDACFGPESSSDRLERGDRFLEEALELLQSGNYPRERIAALTDYVFDRPQGEINQEVGGVMVTLAAYCLAFGIDMHGAGETELARIWTKVEMFVRDAFTTSA